MTETGSLHGFDIITCTMLSNLVHVKQRKLTVSGIFSKRDELPRLTACMLRSRITLTRLGMLTEVMNSSEHRVPDIDSLCAAEGPRTNRKLVPGTLISVHERSFDCFGYLAKIGFSLR